PKPPTTCQLVEQTPYTFMLKWADGDGIRSHYKVSYNCSSPNQLSKLITGAADIDTKLTNFSLLSLEPGSFCEVKIVAVAGDNKTVSNPLSCPTKTKETGNVIVEIVLMFCC
ncbi:hypothetical protein ACJMK2_029166, partial [Sinanodonta woodiana]